MRLGLIKNAGTTNPCINEWEENAQPASEINVYKLPGETTQASDINAFAVPETSDSKF